MLLVSAFFQILDAGQIVLSASLRATGDTGYLLWVTTGASWGLFVPLVWITRRFSTEGFVGLGARTRSCLFWPFSSR
jgi:Na+-driven multidrug efflux pump